MKNWFPVLLKYSKGIIDKAINRNYWGEEMSQNSTRDNSKIDALYPTNFLKVIIWVGYFPISFLNMVSFHYCSRICYYFGSHAIHFLYCFCATVWKIESCACISRYNLQHTSKIEFSGWLSFLISMWVHSPSLLSYSQLMRQISENWWFHQKHPLLEWDIHPPSHQDCYQMFFLLCH